MAKKLRVLLAAVAVVALAVPALANAAEVTKSGGGAYESGAIFTGSSTNTVIFTESFGFVTCGEVTFDAELTENGPQIRAVSKGAGTTSSCNNEGEAVEIEDWTVLNLETTGYEEEGPTRFGVGTITVTQEIKFFFVTCHESGKVSVKYHLGTNRLKIKGALDGKACGESEIEGEFTLSGASGIVLD
jgi:hypothetical protein